jgi:predicted DNA-binding protein YlxM (UPF0122 family)
MRPKPNKETLNLLSDQYQKMSFSISELSEITGLSKQNIYNQVSRNTFPIPTYLEGSRRFANILDVSIYLDNKRRMAS